MSFRSRITIAAVAASLFWLASVPEVIGQSDSTGLKQANAPSSHGNWAVLFQLGNPFQTSSSTRMTLSVKRQKDEKSAIRLGVTFQGNISSTDSERRSFDPNDSTALDFDRSQDYERFGIEAHLVKYLSPNREISIYWGAGPLAELLHMRNKSDSKSGWDSSSRYDLSFGASAALGAEWFFTKRLSISVDYGIELKYTHGWYNFESHPEAPDFGDRVKDTTNAFSINVRKVEFGLAVYF